MPCQVPVASFPFDIGMLTLAPINDDLICAYHIADSAICPPVVDWGLFYRHVIAPLCIVPVDSFSGCSWDSSGKTRESLHHQHLKRIWLPLSSNFQRTFIFFYYPVQRITHVGPHLVVPILIH